MRLHRILKGECTLALFQVSVPVANIMFTEMFRIHGNLRTIPVNGLFRIGFNNQLSTFTAENLPGFFKMLNRDGPGAVCTCIQFDELTVYGIEKIIGIGSAVVKLAQLPLFVVGFIVLFVNIIVLFPAKELFQAAGDVLTGSRIQKLVFVDNFTGKRAGLTKSRKTNKG
ncbi:hypothetical protein [Rhodohalobacter mucosus]|uniref:Uncharacterized protein n=1 Tax=Rhodohalobacter mucosus TaxID=2079485 RepID=A0A316TSB4_9BACT|nr:hypothetical protein [Rhodohalobacter mucosus]PWN07280.1 hypothetical protein DDZ15_03160 [Rhodohalobacter mucosus]